MASTVRVATPSPCTTVRSYGAATGAASGEGAAARELPGGSAGRADAVTGAARSTAATAHAPASDRVDIEGLLGDEDFESGPSVALRPGRAHWESSRSLPFQ